MEVILQVFYSVFSGAILSAAIPNEILMFGAPYLTLVAFIPFYLCLLRCRTFAQAFRAGFIQAITAHLISSFWLAYFKDFAVFTLGASAVGTGFIGGFMGFVYYLPLSSSVCANPLSHESATARFFITPSFRAVYFASAYTIYEWIKSSGFLGYPWGTVSSAMFRWPVIMQVSSITGTYGITFLIVLLNAVLAEKFLIFFSRAGKITDSARQSHLENAVNLSLALVLCTLAYGIFQYSVPRKIIKTFTAVLVQQNADPWKQSSDDESILLSQTLTEKKFEELRESGKKADLVVWSEGVLATAFPHGASYYRRNPQERPLINFIKENGIPLLAGGSFIKNAGKKQINNAALFFDGDGNFRGHYAKNHLVPFAEVIPFAEVPAVSNFLKKAVGISAGWTPGDQYVYFDFPAAPTEHYRLPAVRNIDITEDFAQQQRDASEEVKVRICTPICFDDAFTDIMRPLFLNGAEVFLNITDDSWSLKASSEIQHFVIASYRAIEYRTTLVRCANAGYSVVVDASGRIIADMPLFAADAMTAEIPVFNRTMTTYARWGNWLPYTLIVLVLVYMAYSIITFEASDYIPSERKRNRKSRK